ncbi:sigma-54 dependent transcriptional regulator [Duganella sp.]|uniref:sigma-54 dependent transcriptional regulator n=1 Tax=Duganella sp. TaxID=1904440 RepID=UPI0031DB7517
MAKPRCAIVHGTDAAPAAEVMAALAAEADMVALPPGVAFAPAFDLLLMVSSPASHAHDLALLRRICALPPCCPVLAVNCGLSCAQLEQLLAAGACDFVYHPFSPAELLARLRRALGAAAPPSSAGERPFQHPCLRDYIGNSPAFRRELDKLPRFAACDAGVLIGGETGTGKELCAQAIHYLSARAERPWVAINCGAVPADLIDSELFGHVRGAYTTAHSSRHGLVAEAEGGTLFLDDIDGLPLAAQSKLLRFLQEGEFRVVGSNTVRHANVRVIAASNRDLQALAGRGQFRLDLYFRLNILAVTLPALRERQEDIPTLATHFCQHYAQKFNKTVRAVSPQALRKLTAHDWPGNVRELQHVIERAVVIAAGMVLAADDIDLPDAILQDGEDAEVSFRNAKARMIEEFERGYIEQLLTRFAGNVTRAAQAAGKNRRAFFALIQRYQIEPQRYRPEL